MIETLGWWHVQITHNIRFILISLVSNRDTQPNLDHSRLSQVTWGHFGHFVQAYILSYTQNIKSTMHEESLIVIKPGSQRVVYDGRFVATLINDLNAQTGTYDDAEKWALAGQYSTYFTGTILNSKFSCEI